MSDASFQRSRAFPIASARAPARPLPVGFGLAIGALVSLALWAGLIWLAIRLLG